MNKKIITGVVLGALGLTGVAYILSRRNSNNEEEELA